MLELQACTATLSKNTFFIFKQCFECIPDLFPFWPPAESPEENLPIIPAFFFYDDNQSWPEEHNLWLFK